MHVADILFKRSHARVRFGQGLFAGNLVKFAGLDGRGGRYCGSGRRGRTGSTQTQTVLGSVGTRLIDLYTDLASAAAIGTLLGIGSLSRRRRGYCASLLR